MTSFILYVTAHNFVDENILACFGKIIQELIGSSESECEIALNWFRS